MKSREIIRDLLAEAGITLNGNKPFDLRVTNDRFYRRLLSNPLMEIGQTYMDGWWECDSLDDFFYRILKARLGQKVSRNLRNLSLILSFRLFNLQNKILSNRVARQHYDLGNDLFSAMLDKRMNYSCGYWKNAKTLDEAQEAKLDLICRKTGLKPGMSVLDLGCGWGGFARFAAEKYGVSVTGYNISKEQVKLAEETCAGLPVEIRRQDYREASGRFDAVISIGFFEHVGQKNYRTYMKVAGKCLKPDGIALLHTIGSNIRVIHPNPWTNKYIFPNGIIPSIAQTAKSMEGIFILEDFENFGPDYDKTLMAWHKNFTLAWPGLKDKYGDRFYRMWCYYLLSSAAGFRSRNNQLWQFVMAKPDRIVKPERI